MTDSSDKIMLFNVTFMFPEHEIESGKWSTGRCKITAQDGDYAERYFNKDNPPETRTQPLDEQEILELIGDTLEVATHDDFKNYMEDALDPPQQILQALKPYLKGSE